MSCCSSSSWISIISAIPPSSSSPTIARKSTTSRFLSLTSAHKHNSPTPLTLTAKTLTSPPKFEKLSLLLLQCGTALASVGTPAALAVTGENGGEDLITTLISGGIVAVLYLFVVPPILMNWMRLRWYKRKFLEMYLQFMFVFIFFPGLLLWAPFINFRKFPRDPTMEYPWSTPKDDVPLYKSR